jgi:hypothetical protein
MPDPSLDHRNDHVPEHPELRPLLGESQLRVLGRYGQEHRIVAGQTLWEDGDSTYDLIVILEGSVDIVEHHGRHDEAVIITYG